MNDNEAIKRHLNMNQPDVFNSRGMAYITTSPDKAPTACGVCGEPAITSTSMAWIWVGLCEKHKNGNLAIGQPSYIVLNGEFLEIRGEEK